jgi:hypothetical protein
MPRAPLTEEQKNALIERLKKAREAKLAEEENKVAEKKAKIEKKSKPKEVEEKPVEVAPKVEPTPVHKEPVVKVAPIEPPVHKTPHKPSPKATKPAKEKYAKLVFYKEPSSKKLKKMQSVLGSSSDEDEAEEKVVKSKAAVAQPVLVPKVDPNEQRKLQYQKLSNLAHHFFDN